MENYVKVFGCKEADLEALEEIVSYFNYHSKNLTRQQYDLISVLADKVDNIREKLIGYDVAD